MNLDQGYAILPGLLTPEACCELISLYDQDHLFRSHIDLARYRFGRGEYKYFANPLPDAVASLRRDLYPPLAAHANQWMDQLNQNTRFPLTLDEFLATCHAAGQTKPTPLLLKYGPGDFNCLHQDLYGAIAFPFQIVCFLSQPGVDYTGGEFLLVEQQPRAQSIGHVLTAHQGDGIVFTNRYRPVKGSRGYYRTNVRHGVSRLRSGERFTLGIIFHDAA